MSQTETLNGSVYWQEVREGLFVHNENWNKTIDRLPDLLSAEFALSRLQTVDQLLSSGMQGRGTVGKARIETIPERDVLQQGLYGDAFSVENLFLQWVYQFYFIEGLCSYFHNTPLPDWHPNHVGMLEEALHAMTYIAALIFGYEELEFKCIITPENFTNTELHVKNKVKELTTTLYSKCAEYGESFRRHGVQGTLPRLWDKIARYAQLSALGRTATYEPKRDSAKDLLGYCIIAWSLVHELDENGTV